jgi:hypothetical protein
MVLSDIDAVRLKTSDRSTITREVVTADGQSSYFKLGHEPLIAGSLQLWIDDVLTSTGFTVDETNGVVAFADAPAVNSKLEFQYYWSLFSDEQIQHFLDESTGSVPLASARLLLALAADAAKVAERETLQGGGGLGAVTRDTAVTAKELRETAKAIIEFEVSISELEGIEAADGLTEIAWTEMNLKELENQDYVRELEL